MTQEELGDKVFITRKAVSKWETGKCCPSIDMMKRLSNILGVTLEELTTGKYKDPAKNYEGKNPIVKLFLNKKARTIAIAVIIFVLTFVFISNIIKENKPTHYTIFYDGADYVLRKSEILKVGNQEYLSMGDFYSNRTDTNDDTKYDLTLMVKEGSQYNNIISLTSGANIAKTINIKNVINKLDDKMDNLYLKIEFRNLSGDKIQSEVQLNLNKDISLSSVKKKTPDLNDNMKDFDLTNNSKIKNVNYEIDTSCKSENVIDLTFLFNLNSDELEEFFDGKSIKIDDEIFDIEYEVNSSKLYIENKNIFISVDFDHLRIDLINSNKTVTYLINETNHSYIFNSNYYNLLTKIISNLRNL